MGVRQTDPRSPAAAAAAGPAAPGLAPWAHSVHAVERHIRGHTHQDLSGLRSFQVRDCAEDDPDGAQRVAPSLKTRALGCLRKAGASRSGRRPGRAPRRRACPWGRPGPAHGLPRVVTGNDEQRHAVDQSVNRLHTGVSPKNHHSALACLTSTGRCSGSPLMRGSFVSAPRVFASLRAPRFRGHSSPSRRPPLPTE